MHRSRLSSTFRSTCFSANLENFATSVGSSFHFCSSWVSACRSGCRPPGLFPLLCESCCESQVVGMVFCRGCNAWKTPTAASHLPAKSGAISPQANPGGNGCADSPWANARQKMDCGSEQSQLLLGNYEASKQGGLLTPSIREIAYSTSGRMWGFTPCWRA